MIGLALLGKIPVLAWVALAAVGYGNLRSCQAQRAEAAAAKQREGIIEARAAGLERQVRDQARIIEEQRHASEQGARARDAAEVALASAGDAVVRLQQRSRDLAARACSATAAAPGVGQAEGPSAELDLLADVPGRLAEAGRQLAAVAEERRIAGIECQRDYEALRRGK